MAKRLQRVEYSPVKKTKRRYKKIGLRHRKQLGPKITSKELNLKELTVKQSRP